MDHLKIKSLSDDELISGVQRAVRVELESTEQVLEYLAEIDRRYLYAKRGADSLYTFCRTNLGYSEGAAVRRISAVRIIRAIPEAKQSLSSGAVNLSTINTLKSFIYNEEKETKKKLDSTQKLGLLRAIENKSQAECKKVLVEISPKSVEKVTEKVKPLTPELSEIKFLIPKSLEEKLKELKNLLSHQNKSGTTAELLEIVTDLALKKLKPDPKMPAQKNNAPSTSTAAANVKTSIAENRRTAFRRAKYMCEFVDPLTKTKCEAKSHLHVDHITPRALWPAGKKGLNELDNLRILCRTHDNLAAIEVFSAKRLLRMIEPKLKPFKNLGNND